MSAFDGAIDAMFEDPNISVGASWIANGSGTPQAVRVIVTRPQETDGYRDSRFELPATLIDVRLSEVGPAKNDRVELEDLTVYEIIGLGRLDSSGYVRTCEAATVTP